MYVCMCIYIGKEREKGTYIYIYRNKKKEWHLTSHKKQWRSEDNRNKMLQNSGP